MNKTLHSRGVKFDEGVRSQKAPVIVIPSIEGVTALETFYMALKFKSFHRLIFEFVSDFGF